MHCVTRWKDLEKVVSSVVEKWPALKLLRRDRIKDGWSCPLKDERSWLTAKAQAAKAKEDDASSDSDGSDGSSDSSESDEDDESDDDDAAIAPEDGDAVPTVCPDSGIPFKSLHGGTTQWSTLGKTRCTGHDGSHPVTADKVVPTKKKRTTLLSAPLGVTPLNHVIDSALCDILHTHVVLVKRLETRQQPIGHMAARWFKMQVPLSPFHIVT